MKIFFDTEFTGLHKNTTLISIGCIDENGRTFYAEFNDYNKSQCNDWIQKNVIDNLMFNHVETIVDNGDNFYYIKDSKANIRDAFTQWLQEYKCVEFVSDVCHYDMVLLIDIFGTAFDLPKGVNTACHDINQDIAEWYNCSETDAFDTSREGFLIDNELYFDGDKHNALYDAKVIKEIYEYIH